MRKNGLLYIPSLLATRPSALRAMRRRKTNPKRVFRGTPAFAEMTGTVHVLLLKGISLRSLVFAQTSFNAGCQPYMPPLEFAGLVNENLTEI
jgi:hypothetical protein